jgi:RNA polymerase-binding transcription factor DksA
LTCIKRPAGNGAHHPKHMHYHYFTLEQRDELAEAIRARIDEPGMNAALERLHAPDYGVCESCGGDIPFARLMHNPRLHRCCRCLNEL